MSASGTESSTEEPAGGKQLELMDDHVSKSRSNSPASGAASDHQLSENKESLSPGNLDNYVDVGLVRNNSAYSPELLQTQDTSALQSFSVSPVFTMTELLILRNFCCVFDLIGSSSL